MIEAEYTAQKIELVARCDAKVTQRATNYPNHAMNSATITATNSLKALAGAVLERNTKRNDDATDPEKPRNFDPSKNGEKVARVADDFEAANTDRDPFDDRRFCFECRRLINTYCKASKTRYRPVDTHPRRCADFSPIPDRNPS